MIKNQSIRIWALSILGVAVLALFWGMRSVNAGLELSRQTLAQSLDQEIITLTSATTSSIQAMRWQVLDVAKAEVSEHQARASDGKPTRTFSNSIFSAFALLEWEQSAWKLNWLTTTPAMQGVITANAIKEKIPEWTMLSTEVLRFQRMNDFSGQPYFAALLPIVNGASRMMAVGIFQPSQFPLALSAARTRDVKVVDDKGFALALSHPAYLGSSLRHQAFVRELIGQEDLSLRQEFKNEQGKAILAAGQRIPESNLFLTVEAPLPSTSMWVLKSWLFLLFSGSLGVSLTWFFLRRFFNESFAQNYELAEQVEALKLQLKDQMNTAAAPRASALPELPETVREDMPEVAPEPMPAHQRPLGKLIQSSLAKVRKRHGVPDVIVETHGLENLYFSGEESHMKTVIEEILKNAFEAVAESSEKKITVFGERCGDKAEGFVRVSVTDTGAGIPNANLEKVFEPFFTTKAVDGVPRGLGLNVVRRLVEELKGRVRILSEGHGTRVELEVPLDASKGLTDFQMLNLDFDDIERRQSKPLPPVQVRKPKVRVLD